MSSLEDYVAMIEETCGGEKAYIVIFKYDKKAHVMAKIMERAKLEKSISNVIFELTFKGVSFRLYGTGKAIFRKLKTKDELNDVLRELLL